MTKARFEWDENKDAENQKKHGIAFSLAQYAFADSNRVIADDLTHSATEQRYFCFGALVLWCCGWRNTYSPLYLSRQCHSYLWCWLLAKRKGHL